VVNVSVSGYVGVQVQISVVPLSSRVMTLSELLLSQLLRPTMHFILKRITSVTMTPAQNNVIVVLLLYN